MRKTTAPDDLPAQQRVCVHCSGHLGSHPTFVRKRDADHCHMWRLETERRVAVEHAANAAELQAARTRVAELETELAERPERVRTVHADADTLREAAQERDDAYRKRDWAFQTLSEVRLEHGDRGNGRCRCSLPLDKCGTAAIVDQYPALRSWEHKQWLLLTDSYSSRQCLLPENHPARFDPHWKPDSE